MRRKWGLVFTLAVLGGAALHFLYDVWPNPLTAVLAPVNESVWEHLKLLYWPFLAAAFVLARGADDARGRWCGLLVGLLAAPLLLLGAYYPLRYGFGVHGLWLDLLLYVLAMGAGFLLAYRLQRRALPGWLSPKVLSTMICGLERSATFHPIPMRSGSISGATFLTCSLRNREVPSQLRCKNP